MGNEDWFVRDFEELDEKLPLVAKAIVLEGIDFRQINADNPDQEVLKTIFGILKDNLECITEMTADEIDATFDVVSVACDIVCMVNDGLVEERSKGLYHLTSEGEEYYSDAGYTEQRDV